MLVDQTIYPEVAQRNVKRGIALEEAYQLGFIFIFRVLSERNEYNFFIILADIYDSLDEPLGISRRKALLGTSAVSLLVRQDAEGSDERNN